MCIYCPRYVIDFKQSIIHLQIFLPFFLSVCFSLKHLLQVNFQVHASSSSLIIHKDYISVVMPNSQSLVLHVVIFPFMAQGHTIPLLDISRAFANRGLKVTIVTTPANAPFISSKTNKHPNISLSIIPFPKVQELPHGCENTANVPSMALWTTFIEATEKMKQSFEDVLRHMIL